MSEHHHHWSYHDEHEHGPHHWGGDGEHQSPIDIDLAQVERVEQIDPIRFVNYERPVEGKFVNNGHS
uniref:Alpha-carbonic anhydrase domain-containing protein n=1 Tax=Plectus sambesii TaxID=2011161 RepID=A0A914V2B5_9BILA